MVSRNRKLQEMKKRYPNIDKFPIRQDPLQMENLNLLGVQMPTRFATNDISMYSVMQEMFKKKFSNIHRCPKCGNHLKLNELNILAKAVGVYHEGGEAFCPACGERYRWMIGRDNVTAENLRKNQVSSALY